jgi:hypothetical protein
MLINMEAEERKGGRKRCAYASTGERRKQHVRTLS